MSQTQKLAAELVALVGKYSELKCPAAPAVFHASYMDAILIDLSRLDTRQGSLDAFFAERIKCISKMIGVLEIFSKGTV